MLDNTNNNNNPHKLPLGKLKLTLGDNDGIRSHVSALDSHWINRDKTFQSYVCMLSSLERVKTDSALEEWLYIANCVQQDFEFLLSLSHHEFWSYMVYQEGSMNGVVTFLQRANPFYRTSADTVKHAATSKAENLYAKLLNLVVRIVLRLLTTKESPTEWIEKQHHASLLYNNYLMSVPLLFDIVIAVGDSDAQNVSILKKIFAAVLEIQPNYINDLHEGLAFYESAFLSMQIQVENEGCEGAGGGSLLDSDAETPYDDVVFFALDCAYTLRVLLNVCPTLSEACMHVKLVQCIANFYDLTVPLLYKNVFITNPQARTLKWVNEARQQFILTARTIIKAQLDRAQTEPKSESAQKLVELLQECLSSQTFVVDYQRQYPVERDVQRLLQICPVIKNYKVDFVVSGYQKALSSCNMATMADVLCVPHASASSVDSDEDSRVSPTQPNVMTMPTNTTRDLDLEASAVLDVLPDLGTGFIRRILARYENSEQAIAAILDDNLPPDLAKIDRTEVYIPADPRDNFQRQTGLSHYNVHDGDKYDVLTKDAPQCIIKKGKGLPGSARNAEQLLDDKSHIHELKDRYQQYALVEDSPGDAAEYDDEYDDSYEALIDGQAPPRMQYAQKQSIRNAAESLFEAQDEDDYCSEEDSNDADALTRRNTSKAEFCENPELTRARYEARQQAKWGHRAPPTSNQREVVGVAKGQGQSRETQRNRGQKEAQKSSRANHNRKSGAAFKRSKGMMS